MHELVALFLAAGKSLVDPALEKLRRQARRFTDLARALHKGHRIQRLFAAPLAHRIHGGLEKLHIAYAGNLHRVLKGQKYAAAGALLGLHIQQILAVEGDPAAGHRIAGVAGENMPQGALARAVGAHNGVHFAGLDRQVQTAQDFLALDLGVQVFDLQHACCFPQVRHCAGQRWLSTLNQPLIAVALFAARAGSPCGGAAHVACFVAIRGQSRRRANRRSPPGSLPAVSRPRPQIPWAVRETLLGKSRLRSWTPLFRHPGRVAGTDRADRR